MPLECVLAWILLLWTSQCWSDAKEERREGDGEGLPGHMQPLGSHVTPGYVKRVWGEILRGSEFVEQYVHPKQPVIFEGLIKDLQVRKNWASDKYLRSHFGEEVMGVEQGKKENRSEYGFYLTMKEFLDEYNTSNIYMVSGVPRLMFSEWQLPKFLLCGGFTDHLMFIYLWLSSGGTKSVLHTDSYENLHCVVSGRKEFVLMEPHYAELIGPEHQEKGFFDIDVERVDMNKYPNLAKVLWYQAILEEGDCLYVPYQWLHHVSSFGRNMGVNVWWTPFQFNADDCTNEEELPDFSPLGDFSLHPELQVKEALSGLKKEDRTVHAEDVLRMLEENDRIQGVGREEVYKLLDLLEPGCEGVIKNIDSVPLKNFKEAFEYIVDVGNQYYEEEMQGEWDEDYSDPQGLGEFDGYVEDWRTGGRPGEDDHMTEGGGDYEPPLRDEL